MWYLVGAVVSHGPLNFMHQGEGEEPGRDRDPNYESVEKSEMTPNGMRGFEVHTDLSMCWRFTVQA